MFPMIKSWSTPIDVVEQERIYGVTIKLLYNINGFIRKLPVDHKYAIRQSFTAFLLLTPLFFLEFLGSNDKGDGGQGLYRALSPLGGRQAPFFARDLVANLKKKNYT